jgi:hypothetical protein
MLRPKFPFPGWVSRFFGELWAIQVAFVPRRRIESALGSRRRGSSKLARSVQRINSDAVSIVLYLPPTANVGGGPFSCRDLEVAYGVFDSFLVAGLRPVAETL